MTPDNIRTSRHISECRSTTPIRNSRGHLHVHEINYIIETWLARSSNYGALSHIARQLGISTVTVSNVILRETGKRPRFHALTTEN
ncbi:MAG: hypothetical protein AAFR27_07575 [Pseudomonadota bacterium]